MKLTKQQCIDIGFKELPHQTVMGSIVFELPRRRVLSLGCLGAGNEIMFICEKSNVGDHYTDLVCLHNRDYDGELTLDRLKFIVNFFKELNKDEN